MDIPISDTLGQLVRLLFLFVVLLQGIGELCYFIDQFQLCIYCLLSMSRIISWDRNRSPCSWNRRLGFWQLLLQIVQLRYSICAVLNPPLSRTSIKSRMDQIRCTHRNKGTLTERIDPILVPQQAKQLVIQRRLEDLYVQRIVLVRMDTEILDLVQWDRLVFGRNGIGWRIVLWVGTEGTDVDFTCRDGTVGIDL